MWIRSNARKMFLDGITHLELVTQINSKLFNYERYNDNETVHMANKQNICSLGIRNEYLKISIH